jgi:hypothetical protein
VLSRQQPAGTCCRGQGMLGEQPQAP